jgi:crossover junction endodeoxyribonuclease RusA
MSGPVVLGESRAGALTISPVNVVLPFPPAVLSAHASHKGGYVKARVTKEWRAEVRRVAEALALPTFPAGEPYTEAGDITLTVRFYPPNRRGDRTNFPNRCKPIFDGLADALAVNDARFVPHFEFHAPEKPGRVEIEVASKGERT